LTATATATRRPETDEFFVDDGIFGGVHVAVAVNDHVNDNAHDSLDVRRRTLALARGEVGAAVLG
jgi:hypothetical protein